MSLIRLRYARYFHPRFFFTTSNGEMYVHVYVVYFFFSVIGDFCVFFLLSLSRSLAQSSVEKGGTMYDTWMCICTIMINVAQKKHSKKEEKCVKGCEKSVVILTFFSYSVNNDQQDVNGKKIERRRCKERGIEC